MNHHATFEENHSLSVGISHSPRRLQLRSLEVDLKCCTTVNESVRQVFKAFPVALAKPYQILMGTNESIPLFSLLINLNQVQTSNRLFVGDMKHASRLLSVSLQSIYKYDDRLLSGFNYNND